MKDKPVISLIAPCYNEEENIEPFCGRVIPILEALGEPWEIIFINDGSTDMTHQILVHKHQHDLRIKLVHFSRNFGKEAAMTAGLDYASGQVIIPIDVDLQDPPEIIPEMLDKWREGYHVVLATRQERQGEGLGKRITAHYFYKFMRNVASTRIPANTGDFRLIDRKVVEVIKTLKERSRFMKGLFAWPGFSTTTIYFNREPRHAGNTKWNWQALINLAVNGVVSFSSFPLRLWTYMGVLVSLSAFCYALFLIIRTMVQGVDVPGYASVMTVMLFLGGVQLLSLGMIGEYISRIYDETKQRPIYVVDKTYGIEPQTESL